MSIIAFGKATLDRLMKEKLNAYKSGNIHRYRVIEVLSWIGDKNCTWGFKEISFYAGVSIRTVYAWLKDFIVGGFQWLLRQWFKGRGAKPKLNAKQKEELFQLIKAGPQENGFHSGIWNTAMINEMILMKFGVEYNSRYLCRLLKSIGLSYQKAKFESNKSDEEEYRKAREEWVNQTWPKILEEAKKKNAIILFGDEVSFAMWGSLSRTWAPVNEQPSVKTKGCRRGLKIFGAVNFESGELHYMESISFCLKAKSIKQLGIDGIGGSLLEKLKEIKDQVYQTKEKYLAALYRTLGEVAVSANEELLLRHAKEPGKFNGETYVEFLRQLIGVSSTPIILIEDGAPYHRSKVVKEFLEKHSKISTVPLPTFSPDFNPIEKLWKNTKRDATHCKYFDTFEQLRESVLTAFGDYISNPSKVIGVMSKLRTEAGVAEILPA